MTNEEETRKKAQDLYRGLGWPYYFSRLKFYFAPFPRIEALIPKEGLIVDLGCGYGLFSHYIAIAEPKRTVIGIDLDENKTKYADRGYPTVSCKLGDITQTEIPPADCIVFIHVLHHLPSETLQRDLLITCKEKLKDGGKLIVTEVGKRPFWKYVCCWILDKVLYPKDVIHFRTQEDWKTLLSEIFTNVEVISMHEGTMLSHVTFQCTK
jgi:2-polyprenyl-3-methyl-5-hydroxy-6-metoxy-1,4-benzoquinol methylase